MKRYLDLVPISAKIHGKQSRMSVFCIVLAVFLDIVPDHILQNAADPHAQHTNVWLRVHFRRNKGLDKSAFIKHFPGICLIRLFKPPDRARKFHFFTFIIIMRQIQHI